MGAGEGHHHPGEGCPERFWLPHPLRHSRPGWMKPRATCCSGWHPFYNKALELGDLYVPLQPSQPTMSSTRAWLQPFSMAAPSTAPGGSAASPCRASAPGNAPKPRRFILFFPSPRLPGAAAVAGPARRCRPTPPGAALRGGEARAWALSGGRAGAEVSRCGAEVSRCGAEVSRCGVSCLDPGVLLLRPPGLRRLSPGVLGQPPHGSLLAALGCWRRERECPQSTQRGFLVGLPLVFFGIARGILAG